jgi:hypothetical protein
MKDALEMGALPVQKSTPSNLVYTLKNGDYDRTRKYFSEYQKWQTFKKPFFLTKT